MTEKARVNTSEIQGLYPVKNAHQSFWYLKARIELSVFQDHKKRGEKHQ